MNTQENQDRMNEDNVSDTNMDVSRSRNREAIGDEALHPVSDNEGNGSGDQERLRNTGLNSHEEGQYDKNSDQPEMNPGHVDQ